MRFTSYASLLPLLTPLTSAWSPPSYNGYNLVWTDTFPGATGQLPNEGNWNIIDGNLGVNNELQTYKRNPRQVQTSGGTTLQLIPWHDGSAWTSGRIESKYTFTPAAGRRTMAEAQIRFGGNAISTKQGMWPAFWLLGDSLRHGTSWPQCGELDILETVNGQLTGYGTVHCNSRSHPLDTFKWIETDLSFFQPTQAAFATSPTAAAPPCPSPTRTGRPGASSGTAPPATGGPRPSPGT